MNINNKKELEKLFNFTFYITGECPNEILGCEGQCFKNKSDSNCVLCWREALKKRIENL